MCPVANDIKICTCSLYTELHSIYDDFLKTHLFTYKIKKIPLDFNYFLEKLSFSCLVLEFQDKLGLRNDLPSIFSHDPKDISKIKSAVGELADRSFNEFQAMTKKKFHE